MVVVYELAWANPPKAISDNQPETIQDYTTRLATFLTTQQLTLQTFFTQVGIQVNRDLVHRLGDTMFGVLDLTLGGFVLPVFTGDPSPPQTGQLYYVGGATDHVRARFASAYDSLAKLGEVFVRQVSGINAAVITGASSTTITFGVAQPDTSYGLLVLPSWNTSYWYSGKAVGSVIVNWGTIAPVGSTFDFIIYR
jgi:hypothetical protein